MRHGRMHAASALRMDAAEAGLASGLGLRGEELDPDDRAKSMSACSTCTRVVHWRLDKTCRNTAPAGVSSDGGNGACRRRR